MLILAATPIGNLGDVSSRLQQTLAEADRIYAEDTRQSKKLLGHLGLERRLDAFHEHSTESVLQRIGAQLRAGERVVYISDAGMPGISDPGYELVTLAHQLDVAVDVIPGPSAVINALVLSGLPNHEFAFMGFFPVTEEKRKGMLDRLSAMAMTAVFFEGPSRISQTLEFLKRHVPDTPIAVCRELTKLHQEVVRGPARAVQLDVVKGEFALVIGRIEQPESAVDPRARYQELLDDGMSPSRAIKSLAAEFRQPKRQIYKMIHGEEDPT